MQHKPPSDHPHHRPVGHPSSIHSKYEARPVLNQQLRPQTAYGSPSFSTVGGFSEDERSMGLMIACLFALIAHIVFIALVALIIFTLDFFNISIPLFDTLQVKPRDVTFVLVDQPEAKPRNPNTRNRADRNTRSGGKKIPNMAEAEPQRAAGAPAQKPSPAPSQPAQKAQPKPQPQRQPQKQQPSRRPQPQARPVVTPQPKQQQQPQPQPPQPQPPTPQPPQPKAPPQPKLPTPKTPSNAQTPKLPPNPIAPVIKTPSPPSPNPIASGPVVKSGSSSSSNGSPGQSGASGGPSQIPGSVSGVSGGSRGGAGRPGSSGGAGGRASSNQSGSPGGGGGAPGIDAVAEPDFGPYISELQRRIKRNWMPPSDNRDKRVVAVFTIARDGRLIGIRLSQSSGVKSADDAAVAAIRASAPFRPLPPNYRGSDIDVQFIFDYTVHSGGGIR